MVKVYLKAKTFDELIIKQTMANTLGGRKYQWLETYFAKGEFYVTFFDSLERWKRIFDIIEDRVSSKKVKNKIDKKETSL